jgi:outer membrane protein assembly factor BamA
LEIQVKPSTVNAHDRTLLLAACLHLMSLWSRTTLGAERGPAITDDPTVVAATAHDEKERDTSGITPFAVPFYTPETSFGLGAAAVIYAYPNGDRSLRPSELEMELVGTANRQFEFSAKGAKFFGGNTYALMLQSRLTSWPDLFYGIGPDVADRDREDFKQYGLMATTGFLRELVKGFYVGPACSINAFRMVERASNGQLAHDGPRGADGTSAIGCGVRVEANTTDHAFYPHRGMFLKLQGIVYDRLAGSEYEFQQYILDYKQYLHLAGEHVLAAELYMLATRGDAPFQMLGKLGGFEMMRGYQENKYKDRQLAAVQVEYRFPVYWRLGGVMFGSAGEVMESFDRFSTKHLKAAFGIGLRGVVERDEHIPLRLDIAFDAELNPNVYFGLLEAF